VMEAREARKLYSATRAALSILDALLEQSLEHRANLLNSALKSIPTRNETLDGRSLGETCCGPYSIPEDRLDVLPRLDV
jgi:hypothetical protein